MAVVKEISKHPSQSEIILKCLGVFVRAGTLDVSLDRLAEEVGVSKRMLIHYFGHRETLEEYAIDLLESRLRAQFAPHNFPPGVSLQDILSELWKQTTAPAARGVLLLVMDVSRRAWSGSVRAGKFYRVQQGLWIELLMNYLPDKQSVEDILQAFQGAVLAYLITGDKQRGQRMLARFSERISKSKTASHTRKRST